MDTQIRHSAPVFQAMLDEVVTKGAFSPGEKEAVSGPLSDERRKNVSAGSILDARIPRLLALSGKGGFSSSAEERKVRERFTNVSLLDHVLSVTRGALVLGEIDLRASGTPEAEIEGRLAVIGAVAFLHDADKMLGTGRSHTLTPEDLALLMDRYRVAAFLGRYGQEMSPSQMVALVDQVEPSRSGRMRPGEAQPQGKQVRDCYYVRLADRLDGAFLDSTKGIEAVLKELGKADGFRSEGILAGWRVIDLNSPHTPFLLDLFQYGLSNACSDLCGFPPLIETHHDGRLTVIVPEGHADEILDEAIRKLGRPFTQGMRVDNNARGARDILDAGGDVADLRETFLTRMEWRDVEQCLRISVDTVTERKSEIGRLLGSHGFAPLWPDLAKFPGRLVPAWSGISKEELRIQGFVRDAAMVAVVMACADAPKAMGIPDVSVREKEIISFIADSGTDIPAWLLAAKDVIGKRTILGALAAALVQDDPEARDSLLGKGGLLDLWLSGSEGRVGLSAKIPDAGKKLADAARSHIQALMGRALVRAGNEDETGRCHFTNAPVGMDARIELKTGLYALNVSAFSGREGRPEYFDKAESQTLVSPVAQAEHRLRQLSGKKAKPGLPVYVSSPNSLGLFAALSYGQANEPLDLALNDLLRITFAKGLVAQPIDPLEKRIRIGRYEEMPTPLRGSDREAGQIGFVRQIMESSMRMGRPIHVFRGMPIPNRAYVAFDFLPPALAQMLGGTAFRLEQIPGLISLLKLVETITDTPGMGTDLAMGIADPLTRFGAACDALARLGRLEDEDRGPNWPLRPTLIRILETESTMRRKNDDAILRFGQVMATVQRATIRNDGAGVAETGMRTAIEAADSAIRIGQGDPESLVAAVAGALEATIERRNLVARSEVRAPLSFEQAIEKASRQFVEEVWQGAFKGNSPSAKHRRTAFAIYRFAFEKAARKGPENGANDQVAA